MGIQISRINRVFGDRVLIRRLDRPEKVRGFYIPAKYSKDQPKEQELWWGVVEKFGLDSRFGEAYGIKEGDIVGVDGLGLSNASFDGDDGSEHCWIMEEFIVAIDAGRVSDFRAGRTFPKEVVGMMPVGAHCVVRPHPEEEKRNGLYVPENAKEPTKTGTVLSVSVGELKNGEVRPLRVRIQSEVLFGKYSGNWAKFGDDHFLLVKEEDLIAELGTATVPSGELAHA